MISYYISKRGHTLIFVVHCNFLGLSSSQRLSAHMVDHALNEGTSLIEQSPYRGSPQNRITLAIWAFVWSNMFYYLPFKECQLQAKIGAPSIECSYKHRAALILGCGDILCSYQWARPSSGSFRALPSLFPITTLHTLRS